MKGIRCNKRTKIQVSRKNLPPQRIHRKGHWKEHVLPKPTSAAKGIATPIDPPRTVLNGLRQRRLARKRSKRSKAMRSSISVHDGKRLAGLHGEEWAKSAHPQKLSSKFRPQSKDHSWNLVLRQTGRVSHLTGPPDGRAGRVFQPTASARVNGRDLCTRCCAICGAPDTSFCWCGASLVPTMDPALYRKFAEFYHHHRNPYRNSTDPGDQRAIQAALLDLFGKETSGAPPLLVLAGVCLYLALVGKIDSMPQVQEALLAVDAKALRNALKHVSKGNLFRGDQRPYSPGKAGLPTALRSFYFNLGSELLPFMRDSQRLRSSISRALAVYGLVEKINEERSVKCFGPYFKKRFLEVLCLLGNGQVGGFKLKDDELDFAAAVFPIADNSAHGLRRIFPAAKNDIFPMTKYSKPLSIHGCKRQKNKFLQNACNALLQAEARWRRSLLQLSLTANHFIGCVSQPTVDFGDGLICAVRF